MPFLTAWSAPSVVGSGQALIYGRQESEYLNKWWSCTFNAEFRHNSEFHHTSSAVTGFVRIKLVLHAPEVRRLMSRRRKCWIAEKVTKGYIRWAARRYLFAPMFRFVSYHTFHDAE